MNFHLLGLLLVASLIVNGGHGLLCYQCDSPMNNTACNAGGPTACRHGTDTCATLLIYSGSKYAVVKQCATKERCDIAKGQTTTVVGVKHTVSCCQSDGCNVNAAPPRLLRPGHAAVALLVLGVTSRALL